MYMILTSMLRQMIRFDLFMDQSLDPTYQDDKILFKVS